MRFHSTFDSTAASGAKRRYNSGRSSNSRSGIVTSKQPVNEIKRTSPDAGGARSTEKICEVLSVNGLLPVARRLKSPRKVRHCTLAHLTPKCLRGAKISSAFVESGVGRS
jgi:hypothetical protein